MKMYIETDLFDEPEQPLQGSRLDTKDSEHANKERATLMLESLLTSLLLRRLYLPFRLLTPRVARTFSSKDLRLPSRLSRSQLRSDQSSMGEGNLDPLNTKSSRKKTISLNRNQTEKSLEMMRQSRKAILEGISEQLRENQLGRER